MQFRVGHDVRFELIVEAPSPKEAQQKASELPYDQWQHSYVTMEDCIPLGESPVNPQAE